MSSDQYSWNTLITGLQSELAIKPLARCAVDNEEDTILMYLSTEQRNITNAISLTAEGRFGNPTAPAPPTVPNDWALSTPNCVTVWSSSNDECVRAHDAAGGRERMRIDFGWAVNNTAFSHHDSAFVAVGDDTQVAIVDPRSGTRNYFDAHRDFVFAAAWSPTDPNMFATGAQDATVRFWDVRAAANGPVATLPALTSAIRAVRFSPDGHYVAFSEPNDFVHIHKSDHLDSGSVEDIFGDICGIDFSPDSKSLFVGLSEQRHGGLLELERYDPPREVDEPTWSKQQLVPLYQVRSRQQHAESEDMQTGDQRDQRE